MASLNFSWSHDAPADLTYNLYENGEKVVSDIDVLNFSLLMDGKDVGDYQYYVTAVSTVTKLESAPSAVLTVNFTRPAAPHGLTASLVG